MTALASYSTGTATVSAGGTTVTGTGTIWSGVNARPGDIFQIGNFQSVISDVVDTDELTIPPWGGGAQTGVAYKIWHVSPQRFVGATAMATVNELVAAFNTSGFFVFVDINETDPDPSLGNDGQYASQPTTGKMWVKSAGTWTYLGIFKAFQFQGAWSGATDYTVGDVVTLSGSSYVCVSDHTNHTPPNTTYWQLLASKGDAGSTGATGDVNGIKLTYSTTTTDADPGAGVFRLNNATPASATAAYIDNTQVGGASITAILDTWDDSTSSTRGYVRFEKTTDPTVWAQFRMTGSVVDGGGYRKITLTGGAGSGAFTNGDAFGVSFNRTGDAGAGSGDMQAANNLSELVSKSTARDNLQVPQSYGQCRLTLSGGNLVLSPLNGNLLTVNGTPSIVPDAGVSLAATGLTPGTTYFIYATASAGTINALEASTTGHATSTTSGNKGTEIKSGDNTRTLVGMARVVTGPAWADSGSQRFVLSWFNRRMKTSTAVNSALRSITNASLVEMHSELRAEFLTWVDEEVIAKVAASGYVGTGSQAGYFAIGIDGANPQPGMCAISDGTGGALRPIAMDAPFLTTEGYHYSTILGGGNASTSVVLYYTSAGNGFRAANNVTVRG